jgi:hypothetical protein
MGTALYFSADKKVVTEDECLLGKVHSPDTSSATDVKHALWFVDRCFV